MDWHKRYKAMELNKNFFRKISGQELEPPKVEQYLYYNLEFNVYELYAGKIAESPNYKYIGKMPELMARLQNLEEVNNQLMFHVQQMNLT